MEYFKQSGTLFGLITAFHNSVANNTHSLMSFILFNQLLSFAIFLALAFFSLDHAGGMDPTVQYNHIQCDLI